MTLPNHILQTLFNETYTPVWVVTTSNTTAPAQTPMNVFDAIIEEIETKGLRPAWCFLSLSAQAEGALLIPEYMRLHKMFGLVCAHNGLAGISFIITEVGHGH